MTGLRLETHALEKWKKEHFSEGSGVRKGVKVRKGLVQKLPYFCFVLSPAGHGQESSLAPWGGGWELHGAGSRVWGPLLPQKMSGCTEPLLLCPLGPAISPPSLPCSLLIRMKLAPTTPMCFPAC